MLDLAYGKSPLPVCGERRCLVGAEEACLLRPGVRRSMVGVMGPVSPSTEVQNLSGKVHVFTRRRPEGLAVMPLVPLSPL